MKFLALALGLSSLLLVSACRDEAPAEANLPPRPVLSTLVTARSAAQIGHAGTIEPRYATNLAFRVLGRMIERRVDLGARVSAGDRLASLEPLSLDLAIRSAEGDLVTAQAQAENARATAERQRALLERQATSQAQVDTAEQSLEAANASLTQARSALSKAREQRSYADLVAETDGVITSVSAEVGQSIPAGQPVMTLARDDVREAVVDLPEEFARRVSPGTPFEVTLESDQRMVASGVVREISPAADEATRSRRVRITLADPPVAFRLGSTIRAREAVQSLASIDLPRSALLERDGDSFVWVVDEAARTVSTRPVKVADRGETTIRIASGIEIGMRVVTAGVNSLHEGQAVTFEGAGAR